MIKYNLIGNNDTKNIKETILTNRGVVDIQGYLSLGEKSLYSYELLTNIREGMEMLKDTIENELHIYNVVDADTDGYSSASIMHNYINNTLKYENIESIIHTGKQHGLSRDILCQIDVNKVGLIIIPDAGTNDYKECKMLSELGFKILILDHHQKEYENQYATIINNQMCEYPNKHLCGTGIVLKFIEALDEENWTDEASGYQDINAFANISDSMDLRCPETKYIVDCGLRNVQHKLLKAIINKQSFSIKNIDNPTITDISFYVTPLVNAIIRTCTQDEKEMLFKAFLEEDEYFEYTPRKSKNNPEPKMVMESIYDRIARLGTNARQRQNKIRDKVVDEIKEKYDESNKENAICFINTSKLKNEIRDLSGLVAMRIADFYSKPCLILSKDESKTTNSNIIYGGSARNVNNGGIEKLKSELSSSRLFKFLAGHENAFGVSIIKDNIPLAINYFNKKFSLIENKVDVDFELENNIEYKLAKDIYSMSNLFSNFIKEPMVVVKNVNVDFIGFEKFGNEEKTHWKFQNGLVQYIKFNVVDDILINTSEQFKDCATINVIGRVTINNYGGKVIPQFIIDDYELCD